MVVTFISLGFITGYAEEDIEGSEDHPMISRYESSRIMGYEKFSLCTKYQCSSGLVISL